MSAKRVRSLTATGLVWGAVVFFTAAIVLSAIVLIDRAKRNALSEVSIRAEQFVSGAEASLNRTLLSVDMLLAGTDTLLQPVLAPDGGWDSRLADRLLMETLRRGLLASDMVVVAEEGQILAAAQPITKRMGLSAPASFVSSAWQHAGSPMLISAPTVNVATAERVIYCARVVRMANSRAVVVIAEVPASFISSQLAHASQFPGMVATLEASDGQLIVSVPPDNRFLDRKILPALDERMAQGVATQAPSRFGGAPAIVVARPTMYRSIFVAASVPIDIALSGWRADRRDIIRGSALFIGMLLAFGAIGELRQSRHRIQAHNIELQGLASRDTLTGCLNRRAFFEQASEAFDNAKVQNTSFCCLMTDIDHFKQFNDLHGHSVGDQVIQVVSKAVAAGLREPDILCRYGGEEFCIVLPDTAPEDALKIAERIRAHIEAHASEEVRDSDIQHITLSFGLAALSQGATTLTELIDQADQALYVSKQNGRNRVTAWPPPTDPSV